MEADQRGGKEARGDGQGAGGAVAQVREEEETVSREARRVLPDLEGDTPSTNMEAPSEKRARGEGGETGQARGKQRWVEERGAGEAEGALRPASPSVELSPTHWGSGSPPPREYAPQPVRREPGAAKGWSAGDVTELVSYVKWARRTRGGGRSQGHRLQRPGRRGGEAKGKGACDGGGPVEEDAGRGTPRVSLDCPRERGKKPRVQMLRELLQKEGWYEGEA